MTELRAIEKVGFVGLGSMGSGIARRIMDAGHTVVCWNRTKSKAEDLLAAGMGWADTPREVAEQCDVVFTMLTNTAAIQANAHGDDGLIAGLRPGTVWADLSTIAPDASVAKERRVRAVDQPPHGARVGHHRRTAHLAQLSHPRRVLPGGGAGHGCLVRPRRSGRHGGGGGLRDRRGAAGGHGRREHRG